MRVAVLGAGNGGLASAFDFAQHGHDVALCAPPEFGANVVAVDEAGGIASSGDLEGFAPIRYAGHDVAEALAGAELVVLVGPAYSTEPLATVARPHLTDGTAVLICPGSCAGAIAFKRAVGLELDDQRYTVGETSTLPYAVRVTEPGVINVFLKLTAGLYLAGLPRSGTDRLHGLIKDVWPAVEKGRERLPDDAPERQPGDPPRDHVAQRRPPRAHERRLPVLPRHSSTPKSSPTSRRF